MREGSARLAGARTTPALQRLTGGQACTLGSGTDHRLADQERGFANMSTLLPWSTLAPRSVRKGRVPAAEGIGLQ
jgi:hypothetical protein